MATDIHEKRQKTYLVNRIKEHLPLFVGKSRVRFDVTKGVRRDYCSCCGEKKNDMIQVYFSSPLKRRDKICGECIASLMLKINGNIVIEARRKDQAVQDAKDAIAAQGAKDTENAMFAAREAEKTLELTEVTA